MAQAQRIEIRKHEWSLPQALAITPPVGAGFRDMAERVRALVAIGFGVLRAAAADRIEDDQDGAGHFRDCPRGSLRYMKSCLRHL
jgi:hypothetical protein